MGDDKAVIFRGFTAFSSMARGIHMYLLSQDAQMVVYGHGVQQPMGKLVLVKVWKCIGHAACGRGDHSWDHSWDHTGS